MDLQELEPSDSTSTLLHHLEQKSHRLALMPLMIYFPLHISFLRDLNMNYKVLYHLSLSGNLHSLLIKIKQKLDLISSEKNSIVDKGMETDQTTRIQEETLEDSPRLNLRIQIALKQ